MKKLCLVALLLLGSLRVPGQEDAVTLEDVMQSADQWAKENLDEDALRALQDVDREKVKQVFKDIQKQLHGAYVLDLASLKDAAKAILPLLEGYEDTQPYAAWLKAQLDYLDVADEFRRSLPPPKAVPGQPPKPAPNPAPKAERADLDQEARRAALAGSRQALRRPPETDLHRAGGPPGIGLDGGGGILL